MMIREDTNHINSSQCYPNQGDEGLRYRRKSYMSLGDIFFWTATINNWQRLLWEDKFKDVIIDSINYLSNEKLIDVFGFVIMPTHVHFIWRANGPNGKESPQGSFLKFTAHRFKSILKQENPILLENYKCDAVNKSYEFWQRDPLATLLYNKKIAVQKLKYIHNNPLNGHWQLCKNPSDYKYSSARYYEMNECSFKFLKDMYEEF